MGKKESHQLPTAIASDLLSVLGIPTSTVSHLIGGWQERRISEARDLLLDELRKGSINPNEGEVTDELLLLIAQYVRFSLEGSARLNLRLMAKAIVGVYEADAGSETLQYDFRRLADLSKKERFVLARMHKRAFIDQVKSEKLMRYVYQDLENHLQDGLELHRIGIALMRTGWIEGQSAFGGHLNIQPTEQLEALFRRINFQDAIASEGSNVQG